MKRFFSFIPNVKDKKLKLTVADIKKAFANMKLAISSIFLDSAIAFPLRCGTCSTYALLQFAEIFLHQVFWPYFFNFNVDLRLGLIS